MKEANMKVQYVLTALKNGKNKFTVSQLTDVIRADAGDKALERRTRRALFVARKAGIILEPLRDGGKAVTAYQLSGAIPESALTATTTRKAAKARTKTVTAKTISKEVAAIVAKNKAPSKKAASADVKSKNLATIKSVHAKIKQDVAKHPVTGRELTDEQADVLEEFRALESAWESEEQDREFARAAVRENLKKEAYVE
jgi:hypothetical protein